MEPDPDLDLETQNRLLKTMVGNYKNLCTEQSATIRRLSEENTVHHWAASMMATKISRETNGMCLTWNIADFGNEELRKALWAKAEKDLVPEAAKVTLTTCPGGAIMSFKY